MKRFANSIRWDILGIYLYLSLPVMIFFLGWIKLYFGIPAVAIVVWMLSGSINREKELWRPAWNADNIRKLLLIFLIIAF